LGGLAGQEQLLELPVVAGSEPAEVDAVGKGAAPAIFAVPANRVAAGFLRRVHKCADGPAGEVMDGQCDFGLSRQRTADSGERSGRVRLRRVESGDERAEALAVGRLPYPDLALSLPEADERPVVRTRKEPGRGLARGRAHLEAGRAHYVPADADHAPVAPVVLGEAD
jgi:hypothetical protein